MRITTPNAKICSTPSEAIGYKPAQGEGRRTRSRLNREFVCASLGYNPGKAWCHENSGSSSCGWFGVAGGRCDSGSQAQTFTTLYDFGTPADGTNGTFPTCLIVGNDGNLYGTAAGGGTNGYGTAFKLTTEGTFTLLHTFCADHSLSRLSWRTQWHRPGY